MNARIKERIEQINSGIVPEGYQKTAFGIFPCDWETVEIKDVAYLGKQKYDPTKNQDNPKCVELEHIESDSGELKGYTYAKNQNSIKSVFRKSDILFGKLRPYLGKYLHAAEDGVCSTEIWVVKNFEAIDNNFLYQLVKEKRFINSAQNSAFGTKMPRAEWEKVGKTKYAIPKLKAEQSRIAEILMQWDKAIELQGKLVEAYQKLKKYCLNKMFPKKGSNVPEIRFSGFTAPWEQCKLGELLKCLPFKSFIKEPEKEGKYEVIQQGNAPVLGFANGDPCQDYQNSVVFGDHTLSLYKPRSPFFVATDGVRIIKGKNKIDGFYLICLLERNKPQSEGYKRYYGILANTYCYITNNFSEQKQIGECFDNLDNLIALHQKKREKLVAQRKILQQYLLTGIVRV